MTENSKRTQEAKTVSIVSLLSKRGFDPVGERNGQLLYYSPIRAEKTPSFFVDVDRNVFNDFGGSDDLRGDSIRLIQILDSCNFKQALDMLCNSDLPKQTAPFFFSGQSVSNKPARGIAVIGTRPLKGSLKLCQYVSSRGVAVELAERFLVEVIYEVKERRYYALGFLNDQGGYELRSAGFKGKTDNGISTFDRQTRNVALFEGFFDFLSALQYFGDKWPEMTTIILNTLSNLKATLVQIPVGSIVHCFLDNDQAGESAVERIKSAGFETKNVSSKLFPDHKDFNDFLTGATTKTESKH